MYTKVTLHRNGDVTYWSVYLQQWVRRPVVEDRELAAMSNEQRTKVVKHMERYGNV